MATANIPCLDTKRCGVKSHLPGTQADCQKQKGGRSTSGAGASATTKSAPGLAKKQGAQYVNEIDALANKGSLIPGQQRFKTDLGKEFGGVVMYTKPLLSQGADGVNVDGFAVQFGGGTGPKRAAAESWYEQNKGEFEEFMGFRCEDMIEMGELSAPDMAAPLQATGSASGIARAKEEINRAQYFENMDGFKKTPMAQNFENITYSENIEDNQIVATVKTPFEHKWNKYEPGDVIKIDAWDQEKLSVPDYSRPNRPDSFSSHK